MKTSMEIPREIRLEISKLPRNFTYKKLISLGIKEAKKIISSETSKELDLPKSDLPQ